MHRVFVLGRNTVHKPIRVNITPYPMEAYGSRGIPTLLPRELEDSIGPPTSSIFPSPCSPSTSHWAHEESRALVSRLGSYYISGMCRHHDLDENPLSMVPLSHSRTCRCSSWAIYSNFSSRGEMCVNRLENLRTTGILDGRGLLVYY
jgi:hypothetical protein